MSQSKTLGQVAYEAYAESLGWVSGVTGAPLPQWDDEKVTSQIKQGWGDAAEAVVKECEARAQKAAA